MTLRTPIEPPGSELDRRELRSLADELAGRAGLWQQAVADFDRAAGNATAGGERRYASLYRDRHVDIWLLWWPVGGDTGWHDHDVSSGAVRVTRGALIECNPCIGGRHLEVTVRAGTSFCFAPDHIHRLVAATPASVSIHAYSPPLSRLGQYAIGDGGLLRRVSVSYADELRPLATEPA